MLFYEVDKYLKINRMKKELLAGMAGLVLSSALFAQSPVIIYNGTAGQLFNGTLTANDSAHVAEDSLSNGNTYLKIWGKSADSTLKVGGVVDASYDVFNSVLPLGYTGTVANSVLKFKVFTDSSGAGLRIQFMTNSNIYYAFQWDTIPGADTGFVEVIVPMSQFKTVVNDKLTGVAITDQLLQGTTSQVQFIVYASDSNTYAFVGLDDIEIGNEITTDLPLNNISYASQHVYPNPCRTGTLFLGETQKDYSVMNASGMLIKTGNGKTIDVSDLNAGIYYIKINTNVQKVILE
jgi:hypothetical protein